VREEFLPLEIAGTVDGGLDGADLNVSSGAVLPAL